MDNFILKKEYILNDSKLDFHYEISSCDAIQNKDGASHKISWAISNAGESAFKGTLRIENSLPEEIKNPWFMIPGVFYGDNSSKSFGSTLIERWPRFDSSISKPQMMKSNHWDFAADRTAVPLVYIHSTDRCYAIASLPNYEISQGCTIEEFEPQVGMGFGYDGQKGYIRCSIPSCEEPFTYANSSQSDTTCRRVTLEPGGIIRGTLYSFNFCGDRHGYQQILEWYYENIAIEHKPSKLISNPTELTSLIEDAAYGIINHHYSKNGNYFIYAKPFDVVNEQVANSLGVTLEQHQMNSGFVSGLPICWGLISAKKIIDNPKATEVAIKVADKICTEGISPSGLFWGDFRPGKIFTENGVFNNPINSGGKDSWGSGWLQLPNAVHSRTIADACLSLGKMILELPDCPSVKLWKKALRSNIEVILDLQLSNGHYANYYDARHKMVIQTEGCGGLLWIPALLQATRIFAKEDELAARIENSVKKAAHAYSEYLENEYLWGAPEDNNSATSEDGMNAVLAYCEMYEYFNEKQYLELARKSADWMLTFRKMFNVKTTPGSIIDIYDIRCMGGDIASVSNNHHHAFEILTTPHLLKLSQWTGNEYYRQRAIDLWAFAGQFLCRTDGQFNGFRGACSEQFYWTNWSSWGQDTSALEKNGFRGYWKPGEFHHQKGHFLSFSAIWCINIIILGAKIILDLIENGENFDD